MSTPDTTRAGGVNAKQYRARDVNVNLYQSQRCQRQIVPELEVSTPFRAGVRDVNVNFSQVVPQLEMSTRSSTRARGVNTKWQQRERHQRQVVPELEMSTPISTYGVNDKQCWSQRSQRQIAQELSTPSSAGARDVNVIFNQVILDLEISTP